MGRPKSAAAEIVEIERAAPRTEVETRPAGLQAARLVAFDAAAGAASIELGGRVVDAVLDEALDRVVVSTALARGERVIAQYEARGWVVLGTLRTSATPGVDPGDDYVIEARTVRVRASHEVVVSAGLASLAVRAHGFVETLAQDITTRAAHLHKIVGRMIRLN